jgi:uncharacterized OB-fold protein
VTTLIPGTHLPLPAPSPISTAFWEAAAEGRLLVPECLRCGLRFFVPEPVCPNCWSDRWSWSESPGYGTLYSATTVHRAPTEGVVVPYIIAVVDLDDGWTMMSHLLEVDPDELTLGIQLAVVFRERNGIQLPFFIPR